VPHVTTHPSTARVPITVLLYNGPLLCSFNGSVKASNRPGGGDVRREIEEAAIAQQSGPQLDADDAEDEEDEETEKQHVAEHWQSVQQQHHEYT